MNISKRRPILAFLILFILSGIIVFAVIVVNFMEIGKQTEFRNSLKATNAVKSMKLIEGELDRLYETAVDKTRAAVNLTAMALRGYMDGGEYTGPRVLESGIVVQVMDDKVIYPEGYPYRYDDLTPEFLEERMVLALTPSRALSDDEQQFAALTPQIISGDYWYVDLTDEENYTNILHEEQGINDMIEELEKAFGGYLFLFFNDGSDLNVFYVPEEFSYVEKASDLGILETDIKSAIPLLTIDQISYTSSFESFQFFGEQMTAVILINTEKEISILANNVGLIMTLTLMIMTAVILGLYWVQTYVRDHTLTESQKAAYHPVRIRKVCISAGLVCMILIFFIAIIFDSLGNLSQEAAKNKESLNLMVNRMQQKDDIITRHRNIVEKWSVYSCRILSEILYDHPELRTVEFLAEANRQFASEYIIWFDENGAELLSSNGYIGLDLKTDLSESGSDFGRLLQGASQVILDPETDLIDLEPRQLIGISRFSPETGKYRALVMAVDPVKTWQAVEKQEYNNYLTMLSPSGSVSLIVDKKTGKIIYTNVEGLSDKTAAEIGLYEDDIPGTELDTFKLKYVENQIINFIGPYERDDDYQYYYLSFSELLQRDVFPFAIASAVGFLLIYWIISSIMLWHYRASEYEQKVQTTKSAQSNLFLDASRNIEWQRQQLDVGGLANIPKYWQDLLPEKKVKFFIQIALMMILLSSGVMTMRPDSESTRSVITFIMQGNWKRGLNLLSFTGILLLILAFVIFILFKNLLMSFFSYILDRKTETISRLIFSLIQYAAIIGLLFFAFDYLGFNTTALLASVSVLSLAVTLGAQGLVADILSGIFIIFEDDFHVGDIIEVNGFSGIVQEIGVRSTKLIGIGDNIKIIGNQSVKNVLNMSKLNSWYSIDLRIPGDRPIREIEALLEQELPKIGASIPEIISGPFYKGVMAIGEINTLYIIAECKQIHYRKVQREMNRALLILFEDHGIKIK